MQIEIVSETDVWTFNRKCNDLLSNRWCISGDLIVTPIMNSAYECMYTQMFSKPVPKE